MIYGSVCSSIEAATMAWHSLGWEPEFFSEIDRFPSAVLAHHYPNVPNLGDMTNFKEWKIDRPIYLLVGGTPCQSFSVAGLRKGLDDPRGNLMLTYLALTRHFNPRWIVWENVPGVLSSNEGRDFGAFLTGLGKLGYGFAYRVLDAQYVRTRFFPWAVPQRRRRVFVVGYLGDWRRAAAVLFEPESLRRLTPRECERLQGFPDDFTLIPYRGKPADKCPDGPRYKALGNSMAVNVMHWIGERIEWIEREFPK
ncbi:MAG: DNA (cytosine-5-)-methyltransferase [Pseudomonadota bacterium]